MAVERDVVVIIPAWTASTSIKTALAESLENDRIEKQATLAGFSSRLTEIERQFAISRGASHEGRVHAAMTARSNAEE